jgi:hypothetical protein
MQRAPQPLSDRAEAPAPRDADQVKKITCTATTATAIALTISGNHSGPISRSFTTRATSGRLGHRSVRSRSDARRGTTATLVRRGLSTMLGVVARPVASSEVLGRAFLRRVAHAELAA